MTRPRFPVAVARHNVFTRQVLAAYREAVHRFAGKPWVLGVSISTREREGALVSADGHVIAIHVRKKRGSRYVPKRQRIPREILGIETDVIGATYEPHSGGGVGGTVVAGPHLQPGASIGRANGTGATLGAAVLDGAGRRLLLCAAHTLREGGRFKKGDLVVSPGPAVGSAPSVPVARFERTHLGLDAGIALLEVGVSAENVALISGRRISAPEEPRVGDLLEKSGATSKVTQAVVQGIGTMLGLYPAMHLCPVPEDADPAPLSVAGDSGAVWYDAITGAAKGLHSSGSGVAPSGKEYGVATLLTTVTQSLQLVWPTGVI